MKGIEIMKAKDYNVINNINNEFNEENPDVKNSFDDE